MAYLTDDEKRILLSALSREKSVCERIDRETKFGTRCKLLKPIVESLERKFWYNRFEKEIPQKVLDEFVNACLIDMDTLAIDGILHNEEYYIGIRRAIKVLREKREDFKQC